MKLFLRLVAAAWCCCAATGLNAHSGKARFHLIVDTDGAADDLRTICMLLGNREAEVLAITTSEGALEPLPAARRAAALLAEFHHEGIPVGAGRRTGLPAPPWRAHSERIVWGAPLSDTLRFAGARELILSALAGEEEPVIFVALGSLTNLHDALEADPSAANRIGRIVWYDDTPQTGEGANFRADRRAASAVLASGIPVEIVSEAAGEPIPVTRRWLDSVACVPTVYARKIAATHRAAPLARLVDEGHLRAWDDLVVVRLFAPEAFECEPAGGTAVLCRPAGDDAAGRVRAAALTVLRGKPDAESRVFYGFPAEPGLYAADVAPWIDEAIARHGPSEWRAAVLTNEMHGHLGIYATIGVKMGIRAREYFNIGVDDIRVVTRAGNRPPVSCMNDGLQVGTGASLGHGLIVVDTCAPPRPEARFTFKDKSVRLALKPAYAERIRRDVQRGIALHGDLTEPYWQYIRELALKYWCEFDRHEIFDLTPEAH